VLRAQRGDSDAVAALVRAFLRPAYLVALSVLGRPADAEDIAQDTLIAAVEQLDSCRFPDRFAGWVLQIARNRARNLLAARKLRDAPPPADEPAASEAPSGNPWLRRRLLDALLGLSETQRDVVLLHDLEGWTHAEIGRALEISEGMSRQHLFQARRLLRERLGPDPRDEEAIHGS
jgi:RNA polymerase sigma-70 factor (ECF subfamily)